MPELNYWDFFIMVFSQADIVAAMQFWNQHFLAAGGTPDGISITRECSTLSDVLGKMWFDKVDSVELAPDHPAARLIAAAQSQDATS